MKVRRIAVAIDFSKASEAALVRAGVLAETLGASLHLVHAIPPIPYRSPVDFGFPPDLVDDVRRAAAEQLSSWAERARAACSAVTFEVTTQPATDAIHAAVRERECDWIVMGTRGLSGIKHAFLGSVAERTLRTAPCPVLAVKEEPHEAARPIRRALLCTDFSPHSEAATSLGIALAKAVGAELHVAHVVQGVFPIYGEIPPPADYLEQIREAGRLRLEKVHRQIRDAGLEGAAELLEGDPARVLVELAKRHALDLVVLGTRGHTGFAHVALGSVAERVLRHVPSSVLTTRAASQ